MTSYALRDNYIKPQIQGHMSEGCASSISATDSREYTIHRVKTGTLRQSCMYQKTRVARNSTVYNERAIFCFFEDPQQSNKIKCVYVLIGDDLLLWLLRLTSSPCKHRQLNSMWFSYIINSHYSSQSPKLQLNPFLWLGLQIRSSYYVLWRTHKKNKTASTSNQEDKIYILSIFFVHSIVYSLNKHNFCLSVLCINVHYSFSKN